MPCVFPVSSPLLRRLRGGLLGLVCAAACMTARAQAGLPPPVSWSASQQQASGLRIEHLRPAAYMRSKPAMAEVLDPGSLLRAQAALDAARARRAEAHAALELAAQHASQARALFEAGQNVTRATVDGARAARDSARARLAAADAAVRAAQAARGALLGPALAHRLGREPGLASRLADGRLLVLRVVLAPGERLPPHARVRLHPSGDAAAGPPLQLLGAAPRAGERSQGLAYVALAAASDGLQPGLRVAADVQSSRSLRGVLVPASAVLFHGGQAFVFVASRPAVGGDRQFSARSVSTAWPLGDGYVQPGWPALDVVGGGAGLLLTPPPEAHTLPPAGDSDDGDDD